MYRMKELTKAEEQVMQILWKKGEAFVKEIVDEFEDNKPAYTTIATILKILETKGFVSHHEFGKMYKFFPIIDKDEYGRKYLNNFAKNYFNSSFKKIASFFVEDNEVSINELEEIRRIIDKEIKSKRAE